MQTRVTISYAFGAFRLDLARRVLLRDGEPVPLTPKAFDTLLALVSRAGRVVEKDELLREVWPDAFVGEATLAQNVFTLRKALGQNGTGLKYIETVPKYGYRFVAEVTASHDDLVSDEPREEPPVRSEPPAPVPAVAARRVRTVLVVSAAVLAACLLAVGLRAWRGSGDDAAAPFERMRLSMMTADGKAVRAAVSPDGKYVATVLGEGANESLWIRQVKDTTAVRLVADAEVRYQGITFSPDSGSVYYVVYRPNDPVGVLYRVGALGGTPGRVLADVDSAVAFSPDGRRISFVRNDPGAREGSLLVAEADGTGERRVATRRAPDFLSVDGPAWSPDGQRIVCAAGRTESNRTWMGVVEVRPDDGQERLLTPLRWDFVGQVAWLADSSGVLMDAWDSSASLLSRQIWLLSPADGTARRVTNDLVSYHGASLTADGRALVSVRTMRATSFWVAPGDAPAEARRITSGTGDLVGEVMGVAWTPDGRIVYGSNASGGLDVWVMDASGGGQRQLTVDPQPDVKPSVSPDGRFVVFVSWRTGISHLWRMDIDGGDLRQLTDGGAESYPNVSPDGEWVVYSSVEGGQTLWRVPAAGGETVRLSGAWTAMPEISPDGKLVACFYEDESSPSVKIALIPAEGGAPVRLMDVPSTVFLRAGLHWTAGGRALDYVDNRGGVSNVWSQPVDGGAPKRLTDFTSEKIFRIAWSRDGKRVVFERGTEISDATLISDFTGQQARPT